MRDIAFIHISTHSPRIDWVPVLCQALSTELDIVSTPLGRNLTPLDHQGCSVPTRHEGFMCLVSCPPRKWGDTRRKCRCFMPLLSEGGKCNPLVHNTILGEAQMNTFEILLAIFYFLSMSSFHIGFLFPFTMMFKLVNTEKKATYKIRACTWMCVTDCKWLASGDRRNNLACPHSSWRVCCAQIPFIWDKVTKSFGRYSKVRCKSRCSQEKEHMGLRLHKSLNMEEVTLSDILGASLETGSVWEGLKGKEKWCGGSNELLGAPPPPVWGMLS